MQVTRSSRLDLPESLRRKLLAFRHRVWTVKLIEAFAGAAIGVLAGYLLTFGLDRLIDTPQAVRLAIFAAAILACSLIPLALNQWVWRRRRLDQLARLLGREHPSVGDQLLGIVELAESDAEQARSPALVEAAILQVSRDAEQRDFHNAVPNPRHRQRVWTAALLATVVGALLLATTSAATNAWSRFLAPWKATPRYTFAAIEPLPEKIVVPHGEPFAMAITLAEASQWRPSQAEIRLEGREPATARREEKRYQFELPALLAPSTLGVRLGDYSGQSKIEPMLRPELSALTAEITLPEYLGRKEPLTRDIRGGTLTAVEGSLARFTATVSRELAAATVDGRARTPQGRQFSTGAVAVKRQDRRDDDTDAPAPLPELLLDWRDRFGLSGQQPFRLSVNAVADEPPSLVCEDLPRQRVLLDSEVVAFQVRSRDDFGVKRVGIEWQGLDETLSSPTGGETIIGAGGPDAEFVELAATFSAVHLGIEPQPVAMRVFVEDFHPDRERVYSPACYFEILNAEDHAIWVTAQLSRWQRMSLEVRDRELQLHETNKELRDLSPRQLDDPATRRRIETQAAAESGNARRLSNVVQSGEELLRQAMRNPEVGVGHLERWADMMQILKDIAGNRMPSVADLLKDASVAHQLAQNSDVKPPRQAGQNRLTQSGNGAPEEADDEKTSANEVPSVVDIESSHNPPKPGETKEPSKGSPSQPRLTLPSTMLAGNGSSDQPRPAAERVEEAVQEQRELLAEFEKVADELNEILANLEGSTLVKRLKAASRRQQQVAEKLGTLVSNTFGATAGVKAAHSETFAELASVEETSSLEASHIMDDMAAYFERSRYMRFKVVLEDMHQQDVTAGLRNLGDDLGKENGLSIAQAEYWGETFDRWAEDLVEVTKCGACPGCKAKGSLPPSIVLEVLQILEGEVNLREETRVAEQARQAISHEEHRETAGKLSRTQDQLKKRVNEVVDRIHEIPDAEEDFAREIALLGRVADVMDEAADILSTPETGSRAIAAETEAIELLLQSRRFNPGGGGGGSNPGGGGGGETTDSALALVGRGDNEKAKLEDHDTQQSTGTTGPGLPEEFRSGLDEYFNRLENER